MSKREKKILQFTIESKIYDPNLPQKIKEKIVAKLPKINPEIYYAIDVVFDKSVYSEAEFYNFKLEKPPFSRQGRNAESDQEKRRNLMTAILSQQLEKVFNEIKSLDFDMDGAAIIGDNLDNPLCVEFHLYKSANKEFDKKGKLKNHIMAHSIMPDRPYINEKFVKEFAKYVHEQMTKDAIKQAELEKHTPNMIESKKLFRAIAKAKLAESQDNDKTTITKLTDELHSQATVKSDWPLEIIRGTKAECQENPVPSKIDCPEYLLYQSHNGGHWTFKKVENLKAAQYIITKVGYNLKNTTSIIVLHNLKPVPFTLFEETEEGLVAFDKEHASGKKKLHLSWSK
jgi:hypothetical protein